MVLLGGLKSAKSLSDVASLLDVKPSALAYVLYKKGTQNNYKKFEIPKRHGGTRPISAPVGQLRLVQRRLATYLQNCVDEIRLASGFQDKFSHGFERKRSIVSNAKVHRARRYVLNIDISDFFGTINFGRVRGFFMGNNSFLLEKPVATVLAQIACFENHLPQGSPCSPVIANLIGHVLDTHLAKLAARQGCRYTRYADDITFSTNAKDFPRSIAIHDDNIWTPGVELESLISRSGFAINPSKTRMQYRHSRQEVTGLVVNKRLNTRREYRHTVRAMVNSLTTTGEFNVLESANKNSTELKWTEGTPNQLHGMLAFIDTVERSAQDKDSRVARNSQSDNLSAIDRTFQRFLVFKDFYACSQPVILTEGPTDNIYLTHAIRNLANSYPKLASKNKEDKVELSVRLYKYVGRSNGRLLNLSGGSADLAKFIWLYHWEHQKFSAPGLAHPVIIVIDNDSGARSVYSAIKELKQTAVKKSDPFVSVTANLYLVATPVTSDADSSQIEDLFDRETKSTQVAGKTFDAYSNIETATHYGKMVFAHQVVKKHSTQLNFAGFGPLLDRISAVIDEHASKVTNQKQTESQ